MSESALAFINQLIESLGLDYAFREWEEKMGDSYWVGDYIEEPPTTYEESGHRKSTFILRGYTRQSWLTLEQGKAKIEKAVMKTAILEDGSGIAIFYDSANPVPTGDMELKSIKINLQIQEWRVK